MADRNAIILGGGLAGIAAAVRLLKHGIKPTLIEQRPFLGGRAFSFQDRASGEEIDNGQHVILGVCDQFLALLDELGTRDLIDLEPTLDVPVQYEGKTSHLRAHKVFGNGAALLRYRHLSIAERIAIARLMLTLKLSRIKPTELEHSKSISFADWLVSRGQSTACIERFWNLFVLPVFNCDITEVAAYDGIEFTRTALLGRPSDAAIGYPKCGLSKLIGSPAEDYLRTQGAELVTQVRVETVNPLCSDEIEVMLSNGDVLRSNTVLSGLTPNGLNRVLPNDEPRFRPIKSSLAEFSYSPIVAVHLWYEKPVMSERVKAFVDLGLQWVFNDSALRGGTRDGQHIVVSLSGADAWVTLPKSEVLSRIEDAMQTAFPNARGNAVVNSSVVKTPEATIRLKPAIRQHRLEHRTDIPGFFIAGDWTNTELPATMEGAVLSGNRAAELVAERLRR